MTRPVWTFTAKTEAETLKLGRRLGKILRGGDSVRLLGDLGSGKTTLAKGVAAGAGFRGLVSSPTFTLAHSYRTRYGAVHHLDLYRIAEEESGDIGIEDYLGDDSGICLIEWPAAAAGYGFKDGLDVSIRVLARGRRLVFSARGPRGRKILAALQTP